MRTLHNISKIVFIIIVCLLTYSAIAQTELHSLEKWEERARTKSNMLPMFGKQTKTAKQIEADSTFLVQMRLGNSRKTIRRNSNTAAEAGWNYYKGSLDTAMFRFNQAWLIDSTNYASYVGFATIYATLGEPTIPDEMCKAATKYDSADCSEFENLVQRNVEYFRNREEEGFVAIGRYKPMEYRATGPLFKDRKKVLFRYHWRWYHENGQFLRQVYGGSRSHDMRGELVNYHDNGEIAHRGKWSKLWFKKSKWTSYDRDGKISEIEISKQEGLFSSTYTQIKRIIYSQEIPWDKGNYRQISEKGWVFKTGEYPDGYITKVHKVGDPYTYYSVWKDGEWSDDLIKVVPDDCMIMNAEGNFEWFDGKLYKLDSGSAY